MRKGKRTMMALTCVMCPEVFARNETEIRKRWNKGVPQTCSQSCGTKMANMRRAGNMSNEERAEMIEKQKCSSKTFVGEFDIKNGNLVKRSMKISSVKVDRFIAPKAEDFKRWLRQMNDEEELHEVVSLAMDRLEELYTAKGDPAFVKETKKQQAA